MKACSRCGEVKPLSEFHISNRNKDGHQSRCKLCAKAASRARALSDPERTREYNRRHNNSESGKLRQRAWHVRRAYGLTLEEYEAMRSRAMGCCQICGAEHHRLELDHCHATGTLRGFLCPSCNKILGLARDNAERLRRAASYLEGLQMRSDHE